MKLSTFANGVRGEYSGAFGGYGRNAFLNYRDKFLDYDMGVSDHPTEHVMPPTVRYTPKKSIDRPTLYENLFGYAFQRMQWMKGDSDTPVRSLDEKDLLTFAKREEASEVISAAAFDLTIETLVDQFRAALESNNEELLAEFTTMPDDEFSDIIQEREEEMELLLRSTWFHEEETSAICERQGELGLDRDFDLKEWLEFVFVEHAQQKMDILDRNKNGQVDLEEIAALTLLEDNAYGQIMTDLRSLMQHFRKNTRKKLNQTTSSRKNITAKESLSESSKEEIDHRFYRLALLSAISEFQSDNPCITLGRPPAFKRDGIITAPDRELADFAMQLAPTLVIAMLDKIMENDDLKSWNQSFQI